MGDFWHWFIILLTVGNILACYWLIVWTSKPRSNESAQGSVTGHTWDEDLQELNNPLPRWWLWMFYITIVFGLLYLVLYPGMGRYAGLFGWSQTGQYEQEIDAATARFAPVFQQFSNQDLAALAADPKARQVGERLYLNYCATCHGSDAGGAPGFPSLRDADWLYGGEPDMIKASILDGRNGVMPAWSDALGEQGVREVAAYVQALAGRKLDAGQVAAGKTHYMTYCMACHGEDGKGNTALGAPNLTDAIWLYGGTAPAIEQSIAKGRNGVMPAHREFLGEDKVHVLAAYIYGLSR